MNDGEPLRTLENGKCWYAEGGMVCEFEGAIEIYPGWVRLGSAVTAWLPREKVQKVDER